MAAGGPRDPASDPARSWLSTRNDARDPTTLVPSFRHCEGAARRVALRDSARIRNRRGSFAHTSAHTRRCLAAGSRECGAIEASGQRMRPPRWISRRQTTRCRHRSVATSLALTRHLLRDGDPPVATRLIRSFE